MPWSLTWKNLSPWNVHPSLSRVTFVISILAVLMANDRANDGQGKKLGITPGVGN